MAQLWHVFECTILLHTERAIKVDYQGEELWIPKSQIEDVDDLPARGNSEITVTAWIAKEKGLI